MTPEICVFFPGKISGQTGKNKDKLKIEIESIKPQEVDFSE